MRGRRAESALLAMLPDDFADLLVELEEADAEYLLSAHHVTANAIASGIISGRTARCTAADKGSGATRLWCVRA